MGKPYFHYFRLSYRVNVLPPTLISKPVCFGHLRKSDRARSYKCRFVSGFYTCFLRRKRKTESDFCYVQFVCSGLAGQVAACGRACFRGSTRGWTNHCTKPKERVLPAPVTRSSRPILLWFACLATQLALSPDGFYWEPSLYPSLPFTPYFRNNLY